MVLADTAMSYSVSNAGYQTAAAPRALGKALPHGSKRPLATGSEADIDSQHSTAGEVGASSKVREGRTKKIKTEGSEKPKTTKSKAMSVAQDDDADMPKPKVKKRLANGSVSSMQPANGSGQPMASKPAAVAPIIRGNLRIYPPGPHIAPKISSVLIKQIEASENAVEAGKPKTSKKATMGKIVSPIKQETDAATLSKKGKSESASKVAGTKTKKTSMAPTPAKSKVVAATLKKKVATKESSEPTSAKTTKVSTVTKITKVTKVTTKAIGSKEKTIVRRSSLPAVPVPPPPKPKEVIRYTVGEKTIEELTARDDVEIERRENVKFRKLRGRTLTMPAPPQDGFGGESTPLDDAVGVATADPTKVAA
ncbi:hypothetical protein BC939DRAFT_43586 [Gamsiella multidivaricata]|uniref:uncharacterized protein n=1 Tax=Gamsiella multidivaricata TaxID=101098 RepID=UPI00221E76CE|nr:uncharacterized protein BC939DRAFT_43586 [Gamsiella multidivaricata]KAI7816473.1 hypothetical protein BC939DRAFT_43586 [Gamsiella multidivaricata]